MAKLEEDQPFLYSALDVFCRRAIFVHSRDNLIMTILKKEWDQAKGSLTRNCRVCSKEFKPTAWNQILCTNPDCKKGSFLCAHFKASVKRWESWKNEMKGREEYQTFLKDKGRR